METYTFLRAFADSWFLIVMFGFFIGVWVFAFWPSLRAAREDAASIPFKEDAATCNNDCASCACKIDFLKEVDHG